MKRKPRVQSTRVGAQRQWRSEHDGSPGSCRVCGRGVYDSLDPRRDPRDRWNRDHCTRRSRGWNRAHRGRTAHWPRRVQPVLLSTSERRERMGRGSADKVGGKVDQAKGRVKAAAGELAGDRSLKARGRKDQAKGKGKEAVGRAKNAADELTRRRKKPEG